MAKTQPANFPHRREVPSPASSYCASLLPLLMFLFPHAVLVPASVLPVLKAAAALALSHSTTKGIRILLTSLARRYGWQLRTLNVQRSIADWVVWSAGIISALHFVGIATMPYWTLAVGISTALWLFQRRIQRIILYNGSFKIEEDLTKHGIKDISLVTSDGVRIHGWFWEGPAGAPTLLYFIGARGNSSMRLERFKIWHALGLSVFMLDYRGYGKSEGEPSEAGTYRDAEAAYRHLTTERHIAPDQIAFYGESMGGDVLVDIGLRMKPKGAFLENSPSSIKEMAHVEAPHLPTRWFVRDSYDALSKIRTLGFPIIDFHSPEDQLVPYDMAVQLEKAAAGSMRLVTVQGKHNQGYVKSPEIYIGHIVKALHEFFPNWEPPKDVTALLDELLPNSKHLENTTGLPR